MTTTPSYLLNFFPATFSNEVLSGYAGSYKDDVNYDRLIEARNGWSAWRDVDDAARVYTWKHDKDSEFTVQGFKPVTVRLDESMPLFCRVMLDGLDRNLHSFGFVKVGREGYVNWAVGNFLERIGVRNFAPDPRIGIFPKILIDSFITRFQDTAPVIGVIVDIVYTTRMDVPVNEVIDTGFDPQGLYVKLQPNDPGNGNGIGQAIGRVSKIDGDYLVLEDVRDSSLQRIEATRCLLEAKRKTLSAYIQHCYPTHYRAVQGALHTELNRLISPAQKLRLTEEFVRRRLVNPNGEPISLTPEVGVSFGPITGLTTDSTYFPTRHLLAPTFSFDPESPKTNNVADSGLKMHGPYSRARMRSTTPRILVLAPDIYKGQVEQFVRQFQQGIRGYERTFNGFQQKYRLSKLEVVEHYFVWRGEPAKDAYYNAAVAVLEESTNFDLCFVVIREDFKQLLPVNNPYYVCKSLLLSFGITVQDLRIETLRMPENNFQWTINTLSLASYAKLGGTPFVLKARQLRHHELVIGIGRSIEKPPGSRFGSGKQIIGFTAIFRSDGDYLLSACTPYAEFTDYQKRLEDVVVKSVTEVASSEGIADGDTIRLIFHVYKRTGRREVAAIQNAIAKLTRYKIEFALLHINDSHNLKLFNYIVPELRNVDTTMTKDFIPPRQLMVEIGPRERLINLIGPKQYRNRGVPSPIRITLDRASSYRDLDYLSQQIYEFSFMSWRSFNPGTQPVTVFYSELMASLNSRLKQVAAWNQELVRTKLSRKLWFI